MEHWSNYWNNSASLSSFSEGAAAGGYDGKLAEFWQATFANFPAKANVVDLGTGNGALAALAQKYSDANKKKFAITGIDIAKINPQQALKNHPELLKQIKDIDFKGETAIQDMPFKSDSVDALISQFAFEYAEQKPALTKAMDVLKPGGQLVMVVHHSKSGLAKDSATGVKVLNDAVELSPLFVQADMLLDIATQAIPQVGLEKWGSNSYNGILKRSIQWTMEVLRQRYSKDAEAEWLHDVISRVANVMALLEREGKDQQTINALRNKLIHTYHALVAHKQRLEDQVAAAMTDKQVKALVTQAEKLGASKTHTETFELEGDVFGTVIRIVK